MNKKLIAILLALVMCALSGCALIDNSVENGSSELKITDDYMAGMFLYVEKYDSAQSDYAAYPTNNFDDENAVSLYYATREEHGFTYGELVSSEYLTGVFLGISNAGTNVSKVNPYGKIEVRTEFVYTYELLGGVLYVESVYKKNGKDEYYAQSESKTGYFLNNIGNLSLSSEQNIKVSATDTDGAVKELEYDGKWIADIKFVDYLISAKTVEFDKNYNIIKIHNINLAFDDFIEYQAQPDCEYILIEEEYEVKHSDEHYKYPVGTQYTERYFFNKSSGYKNHVFNAPAGNGFVNYIGLKIKF